MRYLFFTLIFLIPLFSQNNHKNTNIQKEYNLAVSDALYALNIDKYILLAQKGNKQAQYDLGIIYEEGHYPVNINLEKAIEYFAASAEQEYAPALSKIAYFYQKGIILKKDTKKAIKLYKKAASKNNAQAQYKLASMYAREEGLKKDMIIILDLYTRSAKQGYMSSIIALGLYYEMGVDVKKDYKKALFWYTQVKNIPTIPERINNICREKESLCK